MFILFINTFPGCHVSVSIVSPTYLQVLLDNFQVFGWEALFASSFQHLSSFFKGCLFLQYLQIGATLYFLDFSSRFFCFSSLFELLMLLGVLALLLMSCIISFIALVLLLMRVSFCLVWFSMRHAINSSVASACSSIPLALNCFAVSLFCLFLRAYSVEMNVLMFAHIFLLPVCSPTHAPQHQIHQML
jgi:hypothetical protein